MENHREAPPTFVLDALQLAKDTITYCMMPHKLENRLEVGTETIKVLDSILEQYS